MKHLPRIVVLMFFFAGCASWTGKILKDPEVLLNHVEVSDISTKDISLNLRLIVKNPNSIPLKLNEINYSLRVADRMVTEGQVEKGINIPASGEGEVVVPLKFQYSTVGSIFEGLMKRTLTRDYEITGSAKVGIFSIPFAKKGEINFDEDKK